MITTRAAKECGKADYGWLQARYSFSFGHYFDPKLLGYASLRVLNQEVLAPGASLQPRAYPRVDVLNIILQGEAEYRDSEGNAIGACSGEALLLATQPGVTWSEVNSSKEMPLTRLQLWLDACPERENPLLQRAGLTSETVCTLLASPDGAQKSLQLRQQIWIYHLALEAGESHSLPLHSSRAYLQSIHGSLFAGDEQAQKAMLGCGDGAFVVEEKLLTITAKTPLRALVIDLPA